MAWRNPRMFVTPTRFDLAVKVRFFRHLDTGADPDAERVYRWHIEARTGGLERHKTSVDDYVADCRRLLASMRAGFDYHHPVEIGSNDRLKDGAHRISCALLLGHRVRVRTLEQPSRSADWGLEWFRERGMDARDLARIEQDWMDLTR